MHKKQLYYKQHGRVNYTTTIIHQHNTYNIPDNSMMDGECKLKVSQVLKQVQRGHPNYWGATTLAHSHSSTNNTKAKNTPLISLVAVILPQLVSTVVKEL